MPRLLLILLLLVSLPVMAQEAAPPPSAPSVPAAPAAPVAPEAITALKAEGSEATYVGEADGYALWFLHGPNQQKVAYWRAENNRAQFGPVYNAAGEPVGVSLLMEAYMAGRLPQLKEAVMLSNGPGAKLWKELSALQPLAYGPTEAPPLYVFMDPNCPYCHQFDKDARDAAAAGKAFRLLVLPVAILGPDSRDKAIRILAAPDPAAAWLQFMADKALPPVPADATLANQVLDANMKVMMRWNLTMVPHLQWQEEGRTMVIRGNPNDLENFWLRLVAKP